MKANSTKFGSKVHETTMKIGVTIMRINYRQPTLFNLFNIFYCDMKHCGRTKKKKKGMQLLREQVNYKKSKEPFNCIAAFNITTPIFCI